ncbi:hypothetical protein U879_18820 [Defluviimonas sp. 20V17]|uniref:DUF2125 domain-containing protein n=1 Tax=Allgaiera indica TaxID=765699 RepID=A0AAN4US55_9RHOB|nr:hypothetical protein [Allgaiera indica]KDB02133.1 hypothetical protein U879_18820 [Defluviimonas sp. 20V17]GHE02968.1 hypothetical protein GCM10008024_24470 [Allgaiera indica]SDX13733.1 hypothetical protein SAMN05444006_110117 [Allgaiera indica]
MNFLHAAKALSIALALAAPALVSSAYVAPAWAAAATQTQATRVETELARYFDNVPGVVSVTPDGDHYKLRIDPGPLLAQLPPEVKVSLPVLTYRLTDQGGGLWGLDLAEQPLDIAIDAKGLTTQKISIASLSSTGTFDSALKLFRSSTLDAKGIVYSATSFDKGKQVSKVDYTIRSAQSQSHGAAGSEGAVNFSNKMQLAGLTQTIIVPAGPVQDGTPPQTTTLQVTAKTMTQDTKAQGLRWSGMLALYHWFLAHRTQAELETSKTELAGLIRTALPIFDHYGADAQLDDVSVETPVGTVGADKVRLALGANGAVADGKFGETVSIEGPHLPEGIVPPWAVPLVPQTLSLNFDASQFDPAAAAKILLNALEAGTTLKGPAAEEKLTHALLPNGRVTLGTRQSEVTGKNYALSLTGSAQVGPPPAKPDLDFTVKMTGFDAVLKALDAFPPPMKQRAIPMLMLARGFGKAEPNGDLTWQITSSAEGHLLINGQDMGPMK